jgi:hypothetical protein
VYDCHIAHGRLLVLAFKLRVFSKEYCLSHRIYWLLSVLFAWLLFWTVNKLISLVCRRIVVVVCFFVEPLQADSRCWAVLA